MAADRNSGDLLWRPCVPLGTKEIGEHDLNEKNVQNFKIAYMYTFL